MQKTHRRRSFAAVAATVAYLAIMAAPASATTHDAGVTGGSQTLIKTGVTETIDLSPGATGSCVTPTRTFDETGTSIGTSSLTLRLVRPWGTTGTFLLVITRSATGNTNGVLNSTSTPHIITNMRVAHVFTFYNTTGCTPTGTPICTLAVIINESGTSTSITTSHTYSTSGPSVGTVVAFPTCAAGPSYLIGTTVTYSGTGHITTN